ncbi:transcriptional regulator [Curtobacterium sp. 'Ferrero']|uniref:BlaI/MecI/CopY family transcriptional regulator n=1 Tax=Curtobacterium sp. 'Ferrero' TaxID=2033654 RepID=UPI000BCACC93|nr:BlaI/MecI/CopY family transcriptional regulator [Curtobacterium sp. 'Ferrero']PCN48189.1 transcriptional regulator [Curtobacterium sp. 'Ferrero']
MNGRRPHGSLEARVVQVLTAAVPTPSDPPATGRAVRDALAAAGDELAVTTVLTVLTRLQRKGLVERDADGRAYRPTRSGSEATAEAMTAVLARAGDRAAVLQRFTGALDEHDLDVLRAALGSGRRLD